MILFLWGWVLKGNKMFRGAKILWVKSHIGSAEGKRAARAQRLEGKRQRKEERDKFWNQPARTKPTRAQMEREVELDKANKATKVGMAEDGEDEMKS